MSFRTHSHESLQSRPFARTAISVTSLAAKPAGRTIYLGTIRNEPDRPKNDASNQETRHYQSMLIREFRHGDRAQCATIYQLAWQEIFPGSQRSISVEQFDSDTDGEQTLVAEKGVEVVGFASLWRPDSFLHHLHVHPGYRRQGVGTALLERVLRLADSDVSLKCQIDNQRALSFYKHHGFEETGDSGSDDLGQWTRLMLRNR